MMKAAMIATRSAGYARTKARAIKQDTLRSFTKLFSSSAATGKKPDEETNIQSQLRSLYFWGTPNKGTIPTAEALESGRGNGETGGSLVNLERFTGSSVIDYPTEIDSQDAFGIDYEKVAIREVACGPTSTAVILSNNTAFTFGKNGNGQLGHGHRNDVLIPTLLNPPESTPLHHDQISKIKLGTNFTAIIDTNGNLYTCGYNGSTLSDGVGCLGHGFLPEEYIDSPKLVESLIEDGCSVDQVDVGNAHMVVLTTEGEVLTSGSAQWGRIGNLETGDQLFLEPVEILASETDICQIDCGKDYTLALTKNDGIIFAWGKNEKGQCGTGSGLSVEMYAMEPIPVPIEGMLEGRKVVKMSAGHTHAAALTDKGELFVWGMAMNHQPELINDLAHTKIVDIKCGKDYTIALDHDGKIYTFGSSKVGCLGLEKQKKAVIATPVDGMLDKKVTFVDAGWNHVACLTEIDAHVGLDGLDGGGD